MNDETGSAAAALPIRNVPMSEAAGPGSVAERLAELRGEALADLTAARMDLDGAIAVLAHARGSLAAACATALEAGVDLETVAAEARLSPGTARSWAKGSEGQ
jgi:hypothetical protein